MKTKIFLMNQIVLKNSRQLYFTSCRHILITIFLTKSTKRESQLQNKFFLLLSADKLNLIDNKMHSLINQVRQKPLNTKQI